MSQAVGLRRECAPRAQRIRGVRRPRGVVAISTLAVSLVAVLGGSTAASAAPEASVRAAVALSAASEAARPDTSTLRTIMNAPEEAPELTIVGSAPSIAGERAHAVTYTSGGLTVSGVIRTPQGEGPFPAVSVVHGSVNPKTYQSGGGIPCPSRRRS